MTIFFRRFYVFDVSIFFLFSMQSFIQGGSLSSNVTSLLGTKLEKILITVSLHIETSLSIVLLLNRAFQFTDSIDFLILLLFAVLESQTGRSYRGEYSMLRLSLQCAILGWRSVFKVECVLQLTSNLG